MFLSLPLAVGVFLLQRRYRLGLVANPSALSPPL